MSTCKNNKNSAFTLLFREPGKALGLYNALTGSEIPASAPIEDVTLEDALYKDLENSLAFIVDGRLVILIENQSTVHANLPMLLLVYISYVYEKHLGKEAIYRTKLIKIPRPEVYVLYSGRADYPESKILRFSDSFDAFDEPDECDGKRPGGFVEMSVNVLNVNPGFNDSIMRKCSDLDGYSKLVGKVRDFQDSGQRVDAAIASAIDYCLAHGILEEFLGKHSSEITECFSKSSI